MPSVFISYASESQEIASWLAECLRAAGQDPWVATERLVSGDLRDRVIAAATASDCAVFLVSSHWQRKDWCRKESQLYEKRPKEQRILVELEPHETLSTNMPPELATVVGIDCRPDSDRDSAVWRIYCAVTGIEPGPMKEWKQKGAALAVSPAPLTLVTQPGGAIELRASEAEVLECDRDTEFKLISKRYEQSSHHLFLISGSKSEAHDYFIARIEEKLKCEPPHRAVHLTWPRGLRPGSPAVYRERIARAPEVNCRDTDLVSRLRQLLRDRNLILIHPLVENEYDDESIVASFTQWIPDLIREVQPAHRVKCVQPVAWGDAKGLSAAALRWFGRAPDDESAALELMTKLEASKDLLTARVKLTPITERHIIDFCEVFALAPGEREHLLTRIRDRKAATSEQILRIIDKFMDERRAQRIAG